jgi:DNA-directed RNA polymerase specialized sigma24 family protein
MAKNENKEPAGQGRWFPPTRWTEIMAAGRDGSPAAVEALNRLCGAYWYPVYAYIRRRGHSDEDAKDVAQAFFFHVLERNLLGSADRTKGKFRSFLLGALNYFLANRHDFEQAQKRGGGMVFISLDDKAPEERYALEPADELSPEKLFDRRWAMDLLHHARGELLEEHRRQGKERIFEQLSPFLNEESGSGDYLPVASALGMTPGAVTTAVHRLRHRYAELIDAEIARTVASQEEIPSERHYLYEVLSVR